MQGLEPETLAVFKRLAADASAFIDVGANTGVFSLVALSCSSAITVDAFEPVPRIADVLESNISLNHWESRCRVHRVAIADQTGELDFLVPSVELPTSAHLASAAYRSNSGVMFRVPSRRLDEVITGAVDLVKIDVEGAEDQVLRGMTRILREFRPTIVIECLPEGPYAAVENQLDRFGYRYMHLLAAGPARVERITPDPARRFKNFLCSAT